MSDYIEHACPRCGSLLHKGDWHDRDERPDGPGAAPAAPQPNPSKRAARFAPHIPTARTSAPVEDLLQDIMALCNNQLTRLKGKASTAQLDPRDMQSLEALVKTVKMTHDLDRQIRAELEAEFGKSDEGDIRAKLEATRDALGKAQ